jgi:hypothetical protein
MIKTTNIIPALIRKVNPPIKLYKSPPNISPTIMAMLTCLYFWEILTARLVLQMISQL